MLIRMVESNTPSVNKSPSPELFSLIKAAATNLMSFGELWQSIKKKGKDEGFSERELQDLLRPLLKPQLNKDQIYYLFNAEDKKEQSKQSYHRNIPTVPPKKPIEQTSTPPDAEEYIGSPEPKQQGANAFDYKPEPDKEEDPKDLEIQFLKEKVAELEDALKKTEQFKPASQFQEPLLGDKVELDEYIFNQLQQRADGNEAFYYDTYGIDLFKNRELPQLKNRGVKVFKRLYFEV